MIKGWTVKRALIHPVAKTIAWGCLLYKKAGYLKLPRNYKMLKKVCHSISYSIFSVLPVVLMLLFCLALTACQTPSVKGKVIKFSTWGSASEIAVLRQQLDRFEQQNPDIDVELIHIPDNYYQKLHILAAANMMPDVVFTNSIYFPVYAVHGFFQNLVPYLQKSIVLQSTDFYQQGLKAFRFADATNNQALGAIPRDLSDLVVYINKDLFKQANIPLPDNHWTWDIFLKDALALTKDVDNDGWIDQYGFSFYRKPALFTLPFLWSAGGGVLSAEGKTPVLQLTSLQSKAGLQFYQQLRNVHNVVPRRDVVGDANMSQLFIQGKLAMLLSGRWMVPALRANANFDWDVRLFPVGPAGSRVGVDASGYALSAKTKYPEAGWRLIEFLSSAESQQVFTVSGLIIPARKDIAESSVFLQPDALPVSSQVFLTAIKTGVPTFFHPRWNEIEEQYNQALSSAFDGTESVDSAINKAVLPINKILSHTPVYYQQPVLQEQ